MAIWEEIKTSFKEGSYLTRLIYINIAVFVIVQLWNVLMFLSAGEMFSIASFLTLPADISQLIWRPWTLISYMFLHEGFLHLLFNILWLFWFGKMFLEYFTEKKLLSVYLLGGLSGGLLYILAYNVFPAFANALPYSSALGASASVMAIVFAVAFYVPNRILHFFFIEVKLKYIAWFLVGLDILSIPWGNAGGHIAHLGGALFGYLFIMEYKKGNLITKPFDKLIESIFSLFKASPKIKVSYKNTGNKDYDYNAKKKASQKEIDKILEKIAKSGYSSLSKEEKEWLFKHGS